MTAVNNLLDKYREAKGLTSDSAVADSLKLTRQGVHQWRKGLSWPAEESVIAMAQAVDEKPEMWLASIGMDRAPVKAKRYWERLISAAAML